MYHASSVRSTLHFSVKLSLRLASQAHHSNTLSPKTALILTGDLVPPTGFFVSLQWLFRTSRSQLTVKIKILKREND